MSDVLFSSPHRHEHSKRVLEYGRLVHDIYTQISRCERTHSREHRDHLASLPLRIDLDAPSFQCIPYSKVESYRHTYSQSRLTIGARRVEFREAHGTNAGIGEIWAREGGVDLTVSHEVGEVARIYYARFVLGKDDSVPEEVNGGLCASRGVGTMFRERKNRIPAQNGLELSDQLMCQQNAGFGRITDELRAVRVPVAE